MREMVIIILFVIVIIITHCCYCIERQQLEADIERLTSDKADLLTRLQCCEEDLKIATTCESHYNNEIDILFQLIVSIMREKALSGMLAAAAGREMLVWTG